MTTQILLATNNQHKVLEFRHILGDAFDVVTPADLGFDLDVEETGATFAANAALKADAAMRLAKLPALADDSGLVIDALDGEPGVYSARYGGPGLDDHARLDLVLRRLNGVPAERRTARFVAAIALALPASTTEVVEGVVEGVIAGRPSGSAGFGYDPIFRYPPLDLTFAEMTPEQKAAVSHRGRALRAMRDILRDRLGS